MIELEKGKVFLGAENADQLKTGINLIGICYDGTTSFRPGTRFGPDAIREASYGQETYSPYSEKDLEDFPLFDLGNLPQHTSRFDKILENYDQVVADKKLKDQAIKLVTLGGEHSLSQIPIRYYLEEFEDLVIFQFDAHADLREQYLDDPYSHACVMRRVYEKLNENQKIYQYGIRSGTREEFSFMKEKETLLQDFDQLKSKTQSLPKSTPVYLTIDLDFFDPSELPGTGTPEAGGASFKEWIEILKLFRNHNLVGADLVELSPPIDASGNSNSFAAKVLRELLLGLQD